MVNVMRNIVLKMKTPQFLKLLTVIHIGLAVEVKAIEKTIPNNVYFEKMEYQIFNKTLIKDAIIKWKKVAYNVVVFNASMTLTEPVHEIWIHSVLYYKYRQYQKYLVDISVEYCRTVIDPANHPFGQVFFNNYLLLRDYYNISFDIRCPFSGEMNFSTIRGLNVSKIVVPLMQAGRYRMNFYYSLQQNGPIYAAGQVYVSISDLRIWF